MAFVGAGRLAIAARVIEAQARGDGGAEATTPPSRARSAMPVVLAIKAFGDGDYAETVRLLRAVRNIAHRFGGSHAQRDVIDLTLIEAALPRGPARARPGARRRTRGGAAAEPAVAAVRAARGADDVRRREPAARAGVRSD